MFTFTHGANVNVQKHRLGEQDEYDHLKTDSNVTSKLKLIPTTSISKSGIIFFEFLTTQTTRGCICDALWWKTVSCCFCNIHIFKVSTSRRCLTRELGNTQGYPNVFASKTTLRQITWNCPGAGWSWHISILYIDSLRICLDKIYTHVAALGLVPAHYCLSHRKDQRHTPQLSNPTTDWASQI